jgi:hypothetical protein
MIGDYYMLKNGRPVLCEDVVEWARWFETADRVVEQTTIGDVQISTVFLGLVHGFALGNGAPLLWQTMIFGGEHDQEQERYATLAEAKAGHWRWVREVEQMIREDTP